MPRQYWNVACVASKLQAVMTRTYYVVPSSPWRIAIDGELVISTRNAYPCAYRTSEAYKHLALTRLAYLIVCRFCTTRVATL